MCFGVDAWFASCQMTALQMKSSRPPFSVRCSVLPHPLAQTLLHTPWEEVCCAVATLNQHRPNEVSHLTPSSLRPSHGCQSHNEQPSISSAWLTHFDSWESLGPVRSKLPLSKCHHQHIHQPYLWIRPFFSPFLLKKSISKNQQHFSCARALHVCITPQHICTQSYLWTPYAQTHVLADYLVLHLEVIRLSVIWSVSNLLLLMALWVMNSVSPRCLWACRLTFWPKTLTNVNRSSQLITKLENQICVACPSESKQSERGEECLLIAGGETRYLRLCCQFNQLIVPKILSERLRYRARW